MSYRCKDCGAAPFVESQRGDICTDCMTIRGDLIRVMGSGLISLEEFQRCQKTIANSHGSGRGKKAMLALIAKAKPVNPADAGREEK